MMFTRIIHTQAQAQAEREWLRAVQKADDARRKERMQNDSEYREQLLQRRKTKQEQKRKALEEDLLHADARKDADRMAKVCEEGHEITRFEAWLGSVGAVSRD